MNNTVDHKTLNAKELDFVRKVLLTYTRNDSPDIWYPPHSENCNWTRGVERDSEGALVCDCGVMFIIDNWVPPVTIDKTMHSKVTNI